MNAIDVAKRYFELSNKSDFTNISELFSDSASYNSQNTGQFTGLESIMKMQKEFHDKFKSKNWHINNIEEIGIGVVLIDYDFTGETLDGEKKASSGLETITVKNGKIVRVDIKNKLE
jgi:hypothetical protein